MMTTWREHKAELMKNPKFKETYDALKPEYRLASELIAARLKNKLTQEQLAEKAGVNRTVIARLESGAANPTVATVNRVANVLGKQIKLVSS